MQGDVILFLRLWKSTFNNFFGKFHYLSLSHRNNQQQHIHVIPQSGFWEDGEYIVLPLHCGGREVVFNRPLAK